PSWLQSSLQQSKVPIVIQGLESRELVRESARAARIDTSRLHLNIGPLRPSRIPSNIKTHYACSVGQHPRNRRHNRYLAIEPYDRTRVLVPTPASDQMVSETGNTRPGALQHRYLNANWVRESAGGNWWIAGQAPLPNTAHAFLTLCMCPVAPPAIAFPATSPGPHARRVHTIVQLTSLVEGGRRRAHPYFPPYPQQSMVISAGPGSDAPPIHVFNDSMEVIEDAECIQTNLRLRWGGSEAADVSSRRDQGEWRVTHLFYTAWPDFGVPNDNRSILRFAQLVERLNNRHSRLTDGQNESPQILIHCSAGVGRTGSFIALFSLLRAYSLLSSSSSPSLRPVIAPPLPLSPLGPLPRDLDGDLIAEEIDSLREQRPGMVQKDEQAVWVYTALSDAF
ncbi:protein-tyrosine phosphatase-like protein, partial [Gautieria morchelliformis]